MESGPRTTTGSENDEEDAFIYVFDRREGNSPEQRIKTGGLFSFVELKRRIQETLKLSNKDVFVITTTNRDPICDDESWDKIDKGDTLYVLTAVDQELSAPAEERVSYLPHYDTIVKGGMYEYYASEGQNPLPYAFAELIDNSLAATVDNDHVRKIELRLHFDDRDPTRNCMVVWDNGTGMTPRVLNNWAVYRLSKFNRKENKCDQEGEDDDDKPETVEAPRMLNSDISYFGVGGKQAIFFIGTATRMITKTKGSKDVHELTISKEDFERKEKNREAIYSGKIRNRKPCDTSHLAADDEVMRSLIKEESSLDQFTAVIITNINQSHIPYLKSKLNEWTKQLAHIYHYYIHGPHGNTDGDSSQRSISPFKNIDIEVKVFTRGHVQTSIPKTVNLRDIEDDTQSCCIRTAVSTFEFKATVEGTGVVEGVIRYHPFLYDKETYPTDAIDPRADRSKADDEYLDTESGKLKRRRPIFECYWNGRLIPYTMIDEFDWCSYTKKAKFIPQECYNRISGVLWTNDKFQVSTNKLTFLDLEVKLRDKQAVFSRVVIGTGNRSQDRRTAIEKEFTNWLRECHETCDKQVQFASFIQQVTRKDQPKNRQTPWCEFGKIEWDGRNFKIGDLVRIFRTNPITYGSVKRFLLYGDHDDDVFGTGGDIEIVQEPQCLYDDVKIYPLAKLDRSATTKSIKRYMDDEKEKLPHQLIVSWPGGFQVHNGEKRPAGMTVGDIKVEIANKRAELISKLPGNAAQNKRLMVELKIIWHSPNGDEEIVSHISQHGKTWPYWFRKMENIRNLGPHSITLQAVLNESGAKIYADRNLPSVELKFTVTEGAPAIFNIGQLDGPFRVGSPFTIPLDFTDDFGNATKPDKDLKPVLECSGLKIKYDKAEVRANTLNIKGVVALGMVGGAGGKNFTVTVKIPDWSAEVIQTLKVRLQPGPPHTLRVQPDEEMVIQNGQSAVFSLTVVDQAGNITCQPRLTAVCKVNKPGIEPSSCDLSATGCGRLTATQILIKKLTFEERVNVRIELTGHRDVAAVERTVAVSPSNKPTDMDVTYSDEQTGQRLHIKSGVEIQGSAGDFLKGLQFKFRDEANREVKVTDALASKMKANWTPRLLKEPLYLGMLPDIKIPNSCPDSKYCSIALANGSGIECSFTVRGQAGEASSLKLNSASNKNRITIGQVLETGLIWQVKDKYGNDLKWLPANALDDVEINSEGLDVEQIDVAIVGGSIVLKNICYIDHQLGNKDLSVKYGQLTDMTRLLVVSGPPTQLVIVDWDVFQPLVVYNEEKWNRPLIVQLCDDSGNPTTETDVKIQLAKDKELKLIPEPKLVKVDDKGRADFGCLLVSGSLGIHEIQPVALIQKGKSIPGPKLKISIQPDSTRPSAIQLEYNKNQISVVGGNLPTYTVRVMAEDGSLLTSAQACNISMKLWKAEQYLLRPPINCISYSPDSRETLLNSGVKSTAEEGKFTFSMRKVPEVSGSYSIMFDYTDDRKNVLSSQVPLVALAGPPVKLVPCNHPGTPSVSNKGKVAQRTIFKFLKLELKDRYENVAGHNLHGSLAMEIVRPVGGLETPKFGGDTTRLETPFVKGAAHMSNITIDESCPGRNGQVYTIRMHVISPNIPKNHRIEPYLMTFLFYNDARKQSAMAELTKERDNLMLNMSVYQQLFNTTEQLVEELKVLVREADQEEKKILYELKGLRVPEKHLNHGLKSIDTIIGIRSEEKNEMLTSPRRKCQLVPANKETEVLGKVCHLGQVEAGDACRVLSWHMSADMDCTVTHTLKKAKEIYNQSGGKQQVLPMESIYRRTLPDWAKPLPHAKYRPNWNPPGNPVYARNLLKFSADSENCQLVFGMLLGDTIIVDDLDRANNYRKEIVKYTHCPTILTRSGDRIRSNGKFGGLMNKAPPIERLKGAVFGAPLPATYQNICTQLEALQRYKEAVSKRENAQTDLDDQRRALQNTEMTEKRKEYISAQTKLSKLDQQLGFTPKRQIENDPMTLDEKGASNNSAPPVKRARSCAALASPVATPTKQSPRTRKRLSQK